jgi:hypothetical protein
MPIYINKTLKLLCLLVFKKILKISNNLFGQYIVEFKKKNTKILLTQSTRGI